MECGVLFFLVYVGTFLAAEEKEGVPLMSVKSCGYCGRLIPLPAQYSSYDSCRYMFRKYCGIVCRNKAKIKPVDGSQYKPRILPKTPQDFHCIVCGKNAGYRHKFCGITCWRKNKIFR